MFNAMIRPYAEGPMAISGVTWYQGEAGEHTQLLLAAALCPSILISVGCRHCERCQCRPIQLYFPQNDQSLARRAARSECVLWLCTVEHVVCTTTTVTTTDAPSSDVSTGTAQRRIRHKC